MSLDINRYLDSGATNHLTAYPSNLMIRSEFSGPNQVHVGDVKGLSIKHIGKSVFSFPFLMSKSLTLNQLLHVPKINKNLFECF